MTYKFGYEFGTTRRWFRILYQRLTGRYLWGQLEFWFDFGRSPQVLSCSPSDVDWSYSEKCMEAEEMQ